MKRLSSQIGGHTLIEMMIAMLVMALAVLGATSGWAFIARTERVNSAQSELDMNVRKSMEKLKRDLRLTAMDKMFFHPAGPGPYTAVSFPMAIAGTNGLIPMDAGGSNIFWQQTVIYHVRTTTPYRLLRTTIRQSCNSMTDTQLAAQLASVVASGAGGTNSTTETVFENLFTWSIYGQGAIYDGYSPTFAWDPGVSFGSFLVTNSTHDFKFTVIGKNPASSGYRVGVDTLVFTPSGMEREAEAQLPAKAQAGAVPQADYMAVGAWSGNYQLMFPATSTGHTFTLGMDNDRWEETNFRGDGALCSKTVVEFDESINPKDFIVRLDGFGHTWSAEGQTEETETHDAANTLTNCTIRVLVRGRDFTPFGGTMKFGGKTVYVYFVSSWFGALRVKAAYIAEAANHAGASPNAASAGTQLFFSQGGGYTLGEVNIGAGSGLWCRPTGDFEIDPMKSYLISFAISSDNGRARYWNETHAGVPGCYMIVGDSDATVASDPNWVARSPVVSPRLYAVSALYTSYPTNGLFTSQVFDTKLASPEFGNISWNTVLPGGTSLKMKVRTGDDARMTNAPAWSAVSAMNSGNGLNVAAMSAPSRRYVQFQAILDPENNPGWSTPKLKDVTLRWKGEAKMVDVGGVMTKGPNYGICEVTIDGKPLTKALRVDLTIFKDVMGGWASGPKRLTSSMTAEIDPRNTGM